MKYYLILVLVFCISFVSAFDAQLNNGLVTYYTFDDTVSSRVPTGESLTVFEGSPNYVLGKIGNGGNVSNNNNWAGLATTPVFDNIKNRTLNVWIKPSKLASTTTVFDKYQGGGIGWTWMSYADGHIICTNDCSTTSLSTPAGALKLTNWTMITLTKNASDNCFWVNGTLVACTPYTERTSTRVMHIGNNIVATTDFDGVYDEMGWWNRTLNSTEIGRLFASGAGLPYTSGTTAFTELSTSYSSEITSNSNPSITLSAIYNDAFTSASAYLIYNGSTYSTTSTGSYDGATFTGSAAVGDYPVGSNFTFYFEVYLTNSTGTYVFNSTKYNQTITTSVFKPCDATYTTKSVNISIYDEEQSTIRLNSSLIGTTGYTITPSSTYYTNNIFSLNGTTSYAFCLYPNNTNYVIFNMKINSNGYQERNFYLPRTAYDNVTQYLNLYLLNLSLATRVVPQLKDYTLKPVANYTIAIYRKDINTGTYLLADSDLTDRFGQTTAYLKENSVYNFKFYNKTGSLVKDSGDVKIICYTTLCTVPFVLNEDENPFEDVENVTGNYNALLSFDDLTNYFILSWTDNTGDGATHALNITIKSMNGTSTLCYNSSTATIGSLLCHVGTSRATYYANAWRIKGTNYKRIASLEKKIGSNYGQFGLEGFFWSFILLFTLIIVGYYSPPVGIILYLAGLIGLSAMDVIYTNPAVIIAQVLIGGIIIWAFRS